MAKKMTAAQREAAETQAATEAAERLTKRDLLVTSKLPWGDNQWHVTVARMRINRDFGDRVEADVVEIVSETNRPPADFAATVTGKGWMRRFESDMVSKGQIQYV